MGRTIIRDVFVYDGTGSRPFVSSILIDNKKILDMGSKIAAVASDIIIDATGLSLSPGFINTHSHMELEVFNNPLLTASVMQGITTEVLGQDGFSAAPCNNDSVAAVMESMKSLSGELRTQYPWRSFGSFLSEIKASKPPIKLVSLVGHATLRLNIIGSNPKKASNNEILKLCYLLDECMQQGAKGMSLGLIYPPSSYGDIEEISELAKIVKKHDGIIMVHMRNEKAQLIDSINEMLEVVYRSDVRLLVSHLKVLGESNWGLVKRGLGLIEQANKDGYDVTFDQYPWDAASTGLKVCLPEWAYSNGLESLQNLLSHEDSYLSIINATEKELGVRGGGKSIMLSSTQTAEYEWMGGMYIDQIAEQLGMTEGQAVLHILEHEGLAVTATYFCISEEDVQYIMRSPLQSICTDGIIGSHPHPRMYGSFPRFLGNYVRDLGIVPLNEAIRRITSEPARRLRLWDRGIIRPGMAADLVLFDPNSIKEGCTYLEPSIPPHGIHGVWVDGSLVYYSKAMNNRTDCQMADNY